MPYRIELMEDGNHVRVTLESELTRKEHEDFRFEVLTALADVDWNKVLIDTARAKPQTSISDDFEFTSDLQLRLPPKLRTAILHRPDEAERFRFVENVAFNRGVNMRTFTDETQALARLHEG